MYKVSKFFFFASIIALTFLTSCGKDDPNKVPSDVKLTEGGVRYKIFNENEKAQLVKAGDVIEYHFMLMHQDSVIQSTWEKKEMDFIQLPEAKKGDILEAVMKLHVGDSATVWMSVDTLKKRGVPIDSLAPGTDLKYTFKIAKILSPEDIQKKQEEMIMKQQAMMAKQKGIDDKILSKHLKDNNIKAENADGLYYTINQKTNLPKVKLGDTVSVHYRLRRMSPNGKIIDQTIDSSYDRNEPFPLVVGDGSVIKGWDLGLQKLNRGEKATLYIPSWLGYGPRAKGALIPANAILVFEIHVIDKNASSAEAPAPAPAPVQESPVEIEEIEEEFEAEPEPIPSD